MQYQQIKNRTKATQVQYMLYKYCIVNKQTKHCSPRSLLLARGSYRGRPTKALTGTCLLELCKKVKTF